MSNKEDADLNTVLAGVKDAGKMIGDYALGKSLGEGTFGKVKIGTHLITGEKVAVKILEKDRIIEPEDIQRVMREMKILKMLHHPNIIKLYEVIETPKQLYLITEYCPGGELFGHIVQQNRLKEKEACRYFQQIIAGVEYIHKLGVVHRDLKPENLLFDHSRNIKIADFGLSNLYKPGQTLKTACGSPCYAAPEMIAGKKYNGMQVDIWSSGVTLFACICGHLPFEDPSTSALYKKIIQGNYTAPSYLSAGAKDLLRCLLNTDPEKRYTIDMIRNHPWYQQSPLEQIPRGIIVNKNIIPVNEKILSALEDYNLDVEYTRKSLEANKHNKFTTTYYLLLQRYLRVFGKKADMDLQLKQGNNKKIENFDIAKISANNYTPESIKGQSLRTKKNEKLGLSTNQITKTEDSTKPATTIESIGDSSSVDQDLNLVSRENHRLQKQKNRQLVSPLTEPSETIVPRPAVFNERSASPWERPRNSSREPIQPQGISNKEKTYKLLQQKPFPLNQVSQKDGESKESEDKNINKNVSNPEEKSQLLIDKIRIPRRPIENGNANSARERYKVKSQEKGEYETDTIETISTARTDRPTQQCFIKPFMSEKKNTETMMEGRVTIPTRSTEETEEFKVYESKTPAGVLDAKESDEKRNELRQKSAPRGSRPVITRPSMARKSSPLVNATRPTSNLGLRQRPVETNQPDEASKEAAKNGECINQTKRISVSPHDDSSNIAKNLFQKGILTSYEASFFQRFSKQAEKFSSFDQSSALTIDQRIKTEGDQYYPNLSLKQDANKLKDNRLPLRIAGFPLIKANIDHANSDLQQPSPQFKSSNKLKDDKEPRFYRSQTPSDRQRPLRNQEPLPNYPSINNTTRLNYLFDPLDIVDILPNRSPIDSQMKLIMRTEDDTEDLSKHHTYRDNHSPFPQDITEIKEFLGSQEPTNVYRHRFRRYKPANGK